jgi:hypothetical protein
MAGTMPHSDLLGAGTSGTGELVELSMAGEPSARVLIAIASGRSLRFAVLARPVPKGRPRVGAKRTITPERTRSFEDTVAWAAKEAVMRACWMACRVWCSATTAK